MRSNVQVVIDGERWPSIYRAFTEAKARGFQGKYGSFRERMVHGATTWGEILLPFRKGEASRVEKGNASRAARRAEEKALMAQLCAELDARKAAIKDAA